jgi:hypothetical protein
MFLLAERVADNDVEKNRASNTVFKSLQTQFHSYDIVFRKTLCSKSLDQRPAAQGSINNSHIVTGLDIKAR